MPISDIRGTMLKIGLTIMNTRRSRFNIIDYKLHTLRKLSFHTDDVNSIT